jgi:hypothetical protein
MMKFSQTTVIAIGLLLCSNFVLPSLALADPLLIRKSAQGYQYVTAGIGEEEAAQMKKIAKNYSLNLLFSEGVVGRWATDVNVNIYDESSNLMFRIVSAKPVLYVNLPAGTYTILANNNGNKLRHKVTLEADINQKVILNWKDLGNNQVVDEDMPQDAEGN